MRKEILSRVVPFLMLTAGTLLTTAPIARAGLLPEQQCAKSRDDAATKYAQCHGKALAKIFATNDLTKLQPALSKCRVKYTDTWAKIQKKAAGTGSRCDTPRFVLNATPFGETVTDNLTGLVWEKKTDTGGVHAKDDTYVWSIATYGFIAGTGAYAGLN